MNLGSKTPIEFDASGPQRLAEINSALENLRSSLREPPSKNVLFSRRLIVTFFITAQLLIFSSAIMTSPLTVSEVVRNPLTLLADRPSAGAEHHPTQVAEVEGFTSMAPTPANKGITLPANSTEPDVPAPTATLPPEPTVTPRPRDTPAATDTPPPNEYIVQSGDSLSAICARLVPELLPADCIAEIIALNGLPEQGEIAAGQLLLLVTLR